MEAKKGEKWGAIANPDADHNRIHATEYNKIFCRSCDDVDYTNYLRIKLAEKKRAESNKKRKEKDEEHDNNCYHEEENDPQYVLFLRSLKGHEKSYILKGEENGLPVAIKYEGDSSSDKECDLEPRRKLRSAMKRKKGPSDQMPLVENQKEIEMLTGRQLRSKSKSEKEKNVKSSTDDETVTDPDYLNFRVHLKFVDGDSFVFKYGGDTVVYDVKDGKINHVKEDNDESFSDVKFLGCTFYNEGNLNFSTMNGSLNIMDTTSQCDSEFRQKVITVLRKPYNKEEYDRLWQDVQLRKPEERHLDLRNGRERSYSVKKEGKSYLDHYPGLERKLLLVQGDKRKCLNLLRGFFFWLKLPGPFCPWEDTECLAINPGSS